MVYSVKQWKHSMQSSLLDKIMLWFYILDRYANGFEVSIINNQHKGNSGLTPPSSFCSHQTVSSLVGKIGNDLRQWHKGGEKQGLFNVSQPIPSEVPWQEYFAFLAKSIVWFMEQVCKSSRMHQYPGDLTTPSSKNESCSNESCSKSWSNSCSMREL